MAVPDRRSEGTVRNYVGGKWEAPESESEFRITNPGTGEEIATLRGSSPSDVDRAVAAGLTAFEDWRNQPVEARIQPLFELKSLLEDHLDELAERLVRDHGKTLGEAKGELRRGIENVQVACGIPSLMQGGMLENAAPDIDETAIRQPLGVFAAITPFNFPGMIPLWFLPYAVACGNSFILKPSEQDPLVPELLFDLIDRAGFPDGVVQLVNGGPETVDALLTHGDVVGVSFVGSTPVAKHVYETAAATGKRVQSQGGAKNHIVVSASADLDHAAEKTIGSAYACAGERCLANDIALVEESVYAEFLDRVVEHAEQETVGYGLDDGTTIGALISADHEQRVRNYIATGVEEGAVLHVDGRETSVPDYPDGHYLGPTVFGDVTRDMVIAQEELFGPILGVAPVADLETAIEWTNRSDFGNAASLFTGRGAEAREFRNRVEAGNIGVNLGTVAPMAFFHFGGRKDSFFGDLHAQGRDMISFYTDETIYIERWPN